MDLADKYGTIVVHVHEYSLYGMAKFTVGLLLAIVRKINRTWMRVKLDKFALKGLVGQYLHGKTVGIKILKGKKKVNKSLPRSTHLISDFATRVSHVQPALTRWMALARALDKST